MVKKITLGTKNKYALVDEEDYPYLSQHKWHMSLQGYAVRERPVKIINGKRVNRGRILMHRVVNKTPAGSLTDHINHNKLDNRKQNLRNCDHLTNQNNRAKRGTIWLPSKRSKTYTIRLTHFRKQYRESGFKTIEEAQNALEALKERISRW